MSDIHHIGYVVEGDLRDALPGFIMALDTGPFFLIEHLRFDETTYRGAPAEYDHSSAFAATASGMLVEVSQVHSASPPELRDLLGRPGFGHVGWLADDLEDETARLRARGLEPFHTGRTGPADAVWFDARATLGHHVEVLRSAPPLLGFYESVRAAGAEWDGVTDPIRTRG
ncbi:MAG TPA: VOC family protein [Baekduia sp.]|uniref:VOC family protein n=1 Tax=Baekduia sp. TaxID=2600305 RepID=UPI002D79D245|nr:VOC family protein [Baekduia sp.]HET6506088.1 VOC family protein [Baekduia sp.]